MRISDWSSDVCSSDLVVEIGENYRRHFILHLRNYRERLRRELMIPNPSKRLEPLPPDWPVVRRRSECDQARGEGYRSEERRDGKECVSTFRSRWSLDHLKIKQQRVIMS